MVEWLLPVVHLDEQERVLILLIALCILVCALTLSVCLAAPICPLNIFLLRRHSQSMNRKRAEAAAAAMSAGLTLTSGGRVIQFPAGGHLHAARLHSAGQFACKDMHYSRQQQQQNFINAAQWQSQHQQQHHHQQQRRFSWLTRGPPPDYEATIQESIATSGGGGGGVAPQPASFYSKLGYGQFSKWTGLSTNIGNVVANQQQTDCTNQSHQSSCANQANCAELATTRQHQHQAVRICIDEAPSAGAGSGAATVVDDAKLVHHQHHNIRSAPMESGAPQVRVWVKLLATERVSEQVRAQVRAKRPLGQQLNDSLATFDERQSLADRDYWSSPTRRESSLRMSLSHGQLSLPNLFESLVSLATNNSATTNSNNQLQNLNPAALELEVRQQQTGSGQKSLHRRRLADCNDDNADQHRHHQHQISSARSSPNVVADKQQQQQQQEQAKCLDMDPVASRILHMNVASLSYIRDEQLINSSLHSSINQKELFAPDEDNNITNQQQQHHQQDQSSGQIENEKDEDEATAVPAAAPDPEQPEFCQAIICISDIQRVIRGQCLHEKAVGLLPNHGAIYVRCELIQETTTTQPSSRSASRLFEPIRAALGGGGGGAIAPGSSCANLTTTPTADTNSGQRVDVDFSDRLPAATFARPASLPLVMSSSSASSSHHHQNNNNNNKSACMLESAGSANNNQLNNDSSCSSSDCNSESNSILVTADGVVVQTAPGATTSTTSCSCRRHHKHRNTPSCAGQQQPPNCKRLKFNLSGIDGARRGAGGKSTSVKTIVSFNTVSKQVSAAMVAAAADSSTATSNSGPNSLLNQPEMVAGGAQMQATTTETTQHLSSDGQHQSYASCCSSSSSCCCPLQTTSDDLTQFDSVFVTPILRRKLLETSQLRLRLFAQCKYVNEICLAELQLPISDLLQDNESNGQQFEQQSEFVVDQLLANLVTASTGRPLHEDLLELEASTIRRRRRRQMMLQMQLHNKNTNQRRESQQYVAGLTSDLTLHDQDAADGDGRASSGGSRFHTTQAIVEGQDADDQLEEDEDTKNEQLEQLIEANYCRSLMVSHWLNYLAAPSYESQLVQEARASVFLGCTFLPTSNRIIFNASGATIECSKLNKSLRFHSNVLYQLRFLMVIGQRARICRKCDTKASRTLDWDSQESITFDLVKLNWPRETPKFIVALLARNLVSPESPTNSIGNPTNHQPPGQQNQKPATRSHHQIHQNQLLNPLTSSTTGGGGNVPMMLPLNHTPTSPPGQLHQSDVGVGSRTTKTGSANLISCAGSSLANRSMSPNSMALGVNSASISNRRSQVTVLAHVVLGDELWRELRLTPRKQIVRQYKLY